MKARELIKLLETEPEAEIYLANEEGKLFPGLCVAPVTDAHGDPVGRLVTIDPESPDA